MKLSGKQRRTLRDCLRAAALLVALAPAVAAQSTNLERGWQFLPDQTGTLQADGAARAEGWRAARVGLSWNAQFEDLRDYMGAAWYRVRLDAPDLKDGRRALLTFGAVDYFSEVFVNGRKAGEHEGGYTPFIFDVTELVKPGANDLLVRVVDPPMDERENRARFPEMMYHEIPRGKQNWYVQTGGIWQPVRFEIKPKVYIKGLQVTTKTDGRLVVSVTTNESLLPPGRFGDPRRAPSRAHAARPQIDDIKVQVTDPRGRKFDLKLVGGGENQVSFVGQVDSPLLWSPDQPNLYTAEATLPGDRAGERFGFRSFEARDGKFYLNGEPFYMIAALDQDFYPETIYTAPSEEYVRDAMLKARRLGLNMLRCHIKVCEPVYLKVADEVGMLVWYEIPSWADWNHFTPQAAERGERVLREMTERDWNHPSVVIQSIINESWGADLKKPEQRRWLLEAFERAKKLVAPRGTLVVDNSACCDNFHLKTDINDFHQYFSQPDNFERWDKWVADFAARPAWTFSQHGDAQATGREPLVVSEFGNWGLPKLPKDLPWWFARDFGGREVTRPAGVRERFREFQLSSLFADYDALAEATQWHQFRSLKHEIEEIRHHAPIQGYVITEFTDINWEANGLLDMWRNPKAYAAELAKIQQPDVVLARLPKRYFMGGEAVEIPLLLSQYSDRELSRMTVKWSTSTGQDGRSVTTLEKGRARVEPLGKVSFNLPAVAGPQLVRLSLEALQVSGRRFAENSYDLFVYPKPAPATTTRLMFYAPDQKFGFINKPSEATPQTGATVPLLGKEGPFGENQPQLYKALQQAGYSVSLLDPTAQKSLLVATVLDEHVERFLRAGGRAVILANSKEALPASAPVKVVPREGDLDGNWVTNFNWARTNREPFKAVAFTPILGFEAVRTVPRFVVENVPAAGYADVLSGVFYGWVNYNRALAVQMRAGRGSLLLTTFRFDDYGRDPYATHLLDALIRYITGEEFAPKLDWDAAAKK